MRANYLFQYEEYITSAGPRIVLKLPLTLTPAAEYFFHNVDRLVIALGTWWHPGNIVEPLSEAILVNTSQVVFQVRID